MPSVRAPHVFGRQAIPMIWDYAEAATTLGSFASGSLGTVFELMVKSFKASLESVQVTVAKTVSGDAIQADAGTQDHVSRHAVDLHRPALLRQHRVRRPVRLTSTFGCAAGVESRCFRSCSRPVAVPKAEELVATPYRHGTKVAAEAFFLAGMTQDALGRFLLQQAHEGITQSRSTMHSSSRKRARGSEGTASTGWETFLERRDPRLGSQSQALGPCAQKTGSAHDRPSAPTPSPPASSSSAAAAPPTPPSPPGASSSAPSAPSSRRPSTSSGPATSLPSTSPRPPSGRGWPYTPATSGCFSSRSSPGGQAARCKPTKSRLCTAKRHEPLWPSSPWKKWVSRPPDLRRESTPGG